MRRLPAGSKRFWFVRWVRAAHEAVVMDANVRQTTLDAEDAIAASLRPLHYSNIATHGAMYCVRRSAASLGSPYRWVPLPRHARAAIRPAAPTRANS